jgi:beta-ureidopropionase / N-carbamoyl-L-amino-acid hydrolase
MTGIAPELHIDAKRFWETLAGSFSIGRCETGGVRRLALDPAEKEMRDYFVDQCERSGFPVTVDGVGNIFATREGNTPGLAPVLIGSHLDSQVEAGPFDGPIGVFAGLEILRSLDDFDVETRRPVVAVSWTNEEGPRFSLPLMGSGVFAGALEEAQVLAMADPAGVTVEQALTEIGYRTQAASRPSTPDSYFELHIEQSAALHETSCDVGIVAGGGVIRYLLVSIGGEAGHPGATPMDRRHDALLAAADVAAVAGRIWQDNGEGAKSTVTAVTAWPNRTGVIANTAQVRIDMRHPSREGMQSMIDDLDSACRRIGTELGVSIEHQIVADFNELSFNHDLVTLLEAQAKSLGIDYTVMRTQVGHDAYSLATVCPSVMVFCPCVDGLSHHPAEQVERERATASVALLLHAVAERACQGDQSGQAEHRATGGT